MQYSLKRKDAAPRAMPKGGDMFINNVGDLCMVWTQETLFLFDGVPYIILTGLLTGHNGRYHMERSAYNKCIKVQQSESLQLEEI